MHPEANHGIWRFFSLAAADGYRNMAIDQTLAQTTANPVESDPQGIHALPDYAPDSGTSFEYCNAKLDAHLASVLSRNDPEHQ